MCDKKFENGYNSYIGFGNGLYMLFIPTLQDLFAAHPLLNPHAFLGDAAFDSARLYKQLLSGSTFGTDADGNGRHFRKACIPLNSRAGLENKDYSVNQDGIPCHADLLLAGITQLIGVILADRIKRHQYIRSLKPLIA